MKELEPSEEVKVSELASNIYRGLETTILELQKKLPSDVDGMSTKQLRRALKAVINYPEVEEESAKVMTEREQKFVASMFALHQASVQLEIKAIGEMQREYDLKQQEAQTEQGE